MSASAEAAKDRWLAEVGALGGSCTPARGEEAVRADRQRQHRRATGLRDAQGAATVADRDHGVVAALAAPLWILPPRGSLL